jgi:ketosteroid isomerase-like protein
MKHLRLLLAAALAAASLGVQASDDAQRLANLWVQAYNMHDRAALGALYSDSAYLMMHGAPTIRGRPDIEAFWAEDFQAGNPLTILAVTHAVEGSDTILVHGNYQVVNREDGTIVSLGRFAHIWHRFEGDRWQLDRDMWNIAFEPYGPR